MAQRGRNHDSRTPIVVNFPRKRHYALTNRSGGLAGGDRRRLPLRQTQTPLELLHV